MCHPNRLRSPFCTKTRSSTAHQQHVHNKSCKWSVGFNVNSRTFRVIAVCPTYRMAYIHHITTLAHMYARQCIQFPRMCIFHWHPWLGPRDSVGSAPPPHPASPSLVLNRHGRTDVMAMKDALGVAAAARCMHNAGHLRAGWPRHSASPSTPTATAVIIERRWPPCQPASPTPLYGPHCRTSVHGPSPVTAGSHRCDTHYTPTILRSSPSVSC